MISKSKLSNGLEVFTIRTDGKSVGISMIGHAGALYGAPGVAHFLEHTVLCASKKYPDFTTLANTVDNLGLYRNAYTSQENMNFTFKCLPEHLDQVFEFLSEVATDALLLDSDIEKQRKIIVQEIGRQNNDFSAVSRLNSLASLYEKKGPGVPVLGPSDAVSKMNRDDIEQFYRQRFVAKNFKLVVCGPIEPERIMHLAEEKLSKMSAGGDSTLPSYKSTRAGERIIEHRQDAKQAVLSLTWEGYKSDDPARYAAYLFRVLMASGRLSRLWQSLRQVNALAYTYSAFLVYQRSFGYFSISTGLAPENIDKAIDVIISDIEKIATDGVSDEEFARIQNIVKTSLIFEADSAFDLSHYYAESLAANPAFKSLDDQLERYSRVSKQDIQKIAADFLKQKPHVSVVQP